MFQLDDKPACKTRLNTWHGIYGPLFDFRKKFPDRSPAAVKDFAAMTRSYWGTIRSVDDSVGRLYALLEERNELDKTVFIFAGDNGLLNGEHGMVDKRTMHEPSIRVPMVLRYPPLVSPQEPKQATQFILHEDLAPSILEICNAPVLPDIHGRSWKPLLEKGDANWRKSLHYAYNYEKQFPYTPNVRGVRTDRWKLIRYPHGEAKNLIKDPTQKERVAELQRELNRLLKETGALPNKMPLDEGIKAELPDLKIR